jgi:hypothetical protein
MFEDDFWLEEISQRGNENYCSDGMTKSEKKTPLVDDRLRLEQNVLQNKSKN